MRRSALGSPGVLDEVRETYMAVTHSACPTKSMEARTVDLAKASDVLQEIFENDRWIKDEFANRLSSEILQFAEALAACFTLFPRLDALSEADEQAAYVAGFVHGIFNDLLTSAKLLVSGKAIASGNLMRQAIEGVGVALLCASRDLIWVNKRKQVIRIRYWEKVKAGDKVVAAHQSLAQLMMNSDALRLSKVGVKDLIDHRNFYHQLSHPSRMGLASRMALGEAGLIYAGGSFDDAKIEAYKKELVGRTNFCRTLPKLVTRVIDELSRPQP